MIYTARNVQFLGTDAASDPAKTAATKKDVSGAVSSVASAAGDIFSSFFQYKTAEVQASKIPATSSSGTGTGMSKNLKTGLIVGGGIAAAALILIVVLK